VIYYPLSLGRNFDELRRVVIALQTADAFDVATPADWRPGEPVIVPPPGSCGTAKDRMDGQEDGVTCIDWFFCTKELTEDEIDDAILSDKNRSDVERVGQRRLQEITPAAPNAASLPVSV
jgi:peroxiredoxin (alkyl hydroperoxide reductase subunit C)